jgi:putative SOS response-associated peptidase YedK
MPNASNASSLAQARSDAHISHMCGRIIQSGGGPRYTIVDGMSARDSRAPNYPPRWNGAPGQELLVTSPARCRLMRCVGPDPNWCSDPKGSRKPINAKCETVRDLPTFREALPQARLYRAGGRFFEWRLSGT